MKHLITVSIIVLFTIPATADELGKLTFGIIRGKAATQQQVYATIAIVDTEYKDLVCTGTLIAPRVVVTASHCFADEDSWPPKPVGAQYFQVAVNTLDIATPTTGGSRYTIEKIVLHPKFADESVPVSGDPTGIGQFNDIALLILNKPVTQIKPIQILPKDLAPNVLKKGQLFTITGFGTTDLEGMGKAGVLRIAQTPFQQHTPHEILLGNKTSADACSGDSGGPAYVKVDDKLYLAGITSRGSENATTYCGEGGIYTFATAYLDWIAKESSELKPSEPGTSTTPTEPTPTEPTPTEPTPTEPTPTTGVPTPTDSSTTTPSTPTSTDGPTSAQTGTNKSSKSGGCTAISSNGSSAAPLLFFCFFALIGLRRCRYQPS